MKPIKSLVLVGVLAGMMFASGDASAQRYYGPNPGYGPPPNSQLPGGFWNRQNRLIFGFSGGLGYMRDDIGDVGDGTVAGSVSGHIGGFLGPRFALMFELQANVQQLDATDQFGDPISLVQTAAMVAAQYWLTPQLWIKGGIGVANLQLQGEFTSGEIASNGVAVMGAVGFELFSSRYMSVDLQGRIINGSYDGTGDNITSGTIGVGINWF